jgi:hypothetical protein
VDLTGNYTEPDFRPFPSGLDLTQWGPTMLSTATFTQVGTHGSMEGLYSLKLATRPVANRYEEPAAANSSSRCGTPTTPSSTGPAWARPTCAPSAC